MNREAFSSAYERLCRGFRCDATAERAEATYRTVAHVSALAWEEAIDVLLVEPRMPDRTRLLAAVDAADERVRQRSRPAPYLPAQLPESAPNRDYGQARLDLVKLLLRGKIGKRMLADQLLDLADRFPELADDLVREAAWFVDQASGNGPPLNPLPRSRPESRTYPPAAPEASQGPQERRGGFPPEAP